MDEQPIGKRSPNAANDGLAFKHKIAHNVTKEKKKNVIIHFHSLFYGFGFLVLILTRLALRRRRFLTFKVGTDHVIFLVESIMADMHVGLQNKLQRYYS